MKRLKFILLLIAALALPALPSFSAEKDHHGHHPTSRYEHHGKQDKKDKHGKHDKKGHGDKRYYQNHHGNHHLGKPSRHSGNNKHHGVHNNHKFNKMVRHAIGGGSGAVVWQIGPSEYIVRFKKGKHHYMRRFYTNTGKYGPITQIIMNGPNEWYLASDRNRRYRLNGNHLNVFVNGRPLSPWTLIPNVDIDIHLP